jgi:hypothetical protein
MSPDIEWRIGEDSEQETVVKTLPGSPPRWHKPALIAIVILGVGVGLTYVSIAEPPRLPPTPTPPLTIAPRPTQLPVLSASLENPSLEAAIERDALALANHAGDANFDLGLALDDNTEAAYGEWYYVLLTAGGDWGRDLYTIEQTGTLRNGLVWVDVRQFRRGNFFRQTRFYRQVDGRWQPVLPDRAMWSGELTITNIASPALPLQVIAPREDTAYLDSVINRFEHTWSELCAQVDCPPGYTPSGAWPQVMTLTLMIRPGPSRAYTVTDNAGAVMVQLPSPRITGIYDNSGNAGDPIGSMALDSLLLPALRVASGDAIRWGHDRQGQLFLEAIAGWQRGRIALEQQPLPMFFIGPSVERTQPPSMYSVSARQYFTDLLAERELAPLEAVWRWSTYDPAFAGLGSGAIDQAEATIGFILDRYGDDGVIHFLHALGGADSLSTAIERGLGVKYSEFYLEWLKWTGQRT